MVASRFRSQSLASQPGFHLLQCRKREKDRYGEETEKGGEPWGGHPRDDVPPAPRRGDKSDPLRSFWELVLIPRACSTAAAIITYGTGANVDFHSQRAGGEEKKR